MRTDCKIDKRPIKCPNACRLGYGLSVANVGNLIVYQEHYADGSHGLRTARVLGRVSAPKLKHNDSEVKGWALVMTISEDFTHAYERWVDPADITEVREVPTRMLEFFARPTLPPVEVLRRKMDAGYIVEYYIDDAAFSNNVGPPEPGRWERKESQS